jgi:hypothetical protein
MEQLFKRGEKTQLIVSWVLGFGFWVLGFGFREF